MTYEYVTLNYPSSDDLNQYGAMGFKVWHVRADSGGVPYFVYMMREVPALPQPQWVSMLETHAVVK